MAIASVLDPRCKMRGIEFFFPQIYPTQEARENIMRVRDTLYDLYGDYVKEYEFANEETYGDTRSMNHTLSLCDEHPSGWENALDL